MRRIENVVKLCLVLAVFISQHNVLSQSVATQPYLQDAEPTSMKVMWETTSGTESTIQYGTTNSLGSTASGAAMNGSGGSQIHTVKIEGLTANTKYYYRAKTGNYQSGIYEFKTPPNPSEDEPFTMVLFSDMQSHTWNYEKIVNDGIIKYSKDNMSGNLADDYAMVIVPGDLVGEGYHYPQWSDHYFQPGEDLYSEVPCYPVIGNHDIWELGGNDNSNIDPATRIVHYMKYFDLPMNGTNGYEEEWYYKDYANIRIIGLNSEYNDNQTQLNWFQQVLDDAKTNDDIDFVFAQMHHPHKSELYNSGKNFSSQAVAMLEDYSTESGKISIHLFGHTHGYSRGQSRDHDVVMLNVGCGGGRLDNWNENWPRKDYEEFSVSHDEFGFVVIEVTGGDNPRFELKKMGMGNEDQITPYVLRDEMIVKMVNEKPQTPIAISPVGNSNATTLKGSAFSDSDNDGFGGAHFQMSKNSNFTNLILDDWKQHENWYMAANTQVNDDLTDVVVSGLTLGTTYYWRVRYRDKALGWSGWSETASFVYSNQVSYDPIANFSGNPTVVEEGESVAFTDLSVNLPYAWKWTFEGGTPATSTDELPTVTYATAGSYKVTLEVTNAYGTDTKEIDNYILVTKPSVAGDTVAFYTFEGNFNDVSGNERHGSSTGAAVVNDGDRSQVANFGGSDYIDVYTGTNSSTGLPIKEMTVATWVKAGDYDGWGGFVGLFQDNGAVESGWVLGTRDQKFSVGLNTTGNAMTYLSSNNDYVLNQWYYVAATYNGSTLNLYVDGELEGTSTAQSGNITYPTSGWHTIGRYKDDNEDDGFQGELDNVLILNKAMTKTEIEDSYTNGIITSTHAINGSSVQLVSPNPFREEIKIGSGLVGEITVEIYTQTGEVSMLKKVIKAGDIVDVSSFSRGMYIVRVVTQEGYAYTEKIVKH